MTSFTMVKKRKTNSISSKYNEINKEKCPTCHKSFVSLKHHLAQNVCIPTNSINMNYNSIINYPERPPINKFAINESSHPIIKNNNHNDNIINDTFMETNSEIFYDYNDAHSVLTEPSSVSQHKIKGKQKILVTKEKYEPDKKNDSVS